MIYIFLLSLLFNKESGKSIGFIKTCYLHSFNNIQIEIFKLPEDFLLEQKERKKYASDNYNISNATKVNNYNTSEERDKLEAINYKRIKYDLPKLENDGTDEIPDFILNKLTKLMLNLNQNIFKISEDKFLFKVYNLYFYLI